MKPLKQKRCRNCRNHFTPYSSFEKFCSKSCEFADREYKRLMLLNAQKKAEQRAIKARLLDLEPKAYWWKIARRWFNAAIRARDEGKECISCDTILIKSGKPGGDYDAGHRRSVGSAKHLEFDPRNVHGQCKYCNDHLAGNPDAYNAKLPSRIGQEAFDALMCDQEPRNLTISDYKAIIESSKQLLRELKNG